MRKADTQSNELRREHDSLVAQRLSRKNQNAPTSHLPVELFGNILVASMTEAHLNPMWRLRELAEVSRHWRDVVLETPPLWSVVYENMSPVQVRWALQRSQGRSLDVTFDEHHSQLGQAGARFLDAVAPVAFRWRALTFGECSPQLASCLKSQARQLEEININGNPHVRMKVVELGEGVHFRHVDASFVALPWSSPRLAGLSTLNIRHLVGGYAPTLKQLITILEASPALESLRVSRLYPVELGDAPEDEPFPTTEPTTLPNLLHLYLHDLPHQLYASLLSRLRFPSCRRLSLDSYGMADLSPAPSTYDHATESFVESVTSLLSSDPHIHIILSGMSMIVASDNVYRNHNSNDRRLHLVIRLGEADSVAETARQVAKLIELACPRARVDLKVERHSCPEFPPDVIRIFPTLHHLKLNAHVGREILRYLCAQVNDEEPWPCPDLKGLDISELSHVSAQHIRYWVRGRWELYEGLSDVEPEGLIRVKGPHNSDEVWQPV